MGFAASQARLLLLTARKSDLEFRAQQITNAEMMLAMQTEEVAREYANALSNQTVKLVGVEKEDFMASTLYDNSNKTMILQTYIGPVPAEDEDLNNHENWATYDVEANGDLDGAEILRRMNAGTLRIIDNNKNIIDVNSTALSVTYDTSDDAAADAEYRRKTAALQVKEKRLQMELQQIEAQQKACDTEIESVKKIMDKNIEKTFKVFS